MRDGDVIIFIKKHQFDLALGLNIVGNILFEMSFLHFTSVIRSINFVQKKYKVCKILIIKHDTVADQTFEKEQIGIQRYK